MVAPIFVHFAATVGSDLEAGTRIALWIGLGLASAAPCSASRSTRSAARARRRRPRALPGGSARRRGTRRRCSPDSARRWAAGRPSPRAPTDVAPDAVQAGQQSRAHRPGPLRLRRLRARGARDRAGRRQLAPGREALVVCVWQPADVGFVPVDGRHFDAGRADEVARPPRRPPPREHRWPQQAGFEPRSVAVKAAPTWKGIVEVAEERGASLIVLGSHRRSGLVGHSARQRRSRHGGACPGVGPCRAPPHLTPAHVDNLPLAPGVRS